MRLVNIFLLTIITVTATTAYARWFQDKQSFETETFGKIVFSHDVHLEAVGSNCEVCHNEIYHIIKKKNPTYTMEDMQKGKSCGACHNGKRAFSVDKDCISCHAGDVTWMGDEIGKTAFSHSVHVELEYNCDECHPDLFKPKINGQKMTMSAMEQGEYCGVCHDGDSAFSVKTNCISCHVGAIDIVWQKDNIGETRFSHTVHLDMEYGCSECHPDVFKPKHNGQTMTMSAMNEGEYCGTCHDDDTAFSVQKDCASCHAGDLTWENKTIGDTIFSHSFHMEMEYSCDECHPDVFKPKHKGQEIKMHAMGKGEYCGVCHDGDTAFSVKRECDTCHKK
jgi:c(7)-type cytochrome triheme protein